MADVLMAPPLDRANADLLYYRNFDLRREHPKIGEWFDAMESRKCYQGIRSDHHTHAHVIPLGDWWRTLPEPEDSEVRRLIDDGPYVLEEVNPDSMPEP